MSGGEAHWNAVYAKATDQVSWWQREPLRSLQMIADAGGTPDAPIVDIGGGASTLVDHLLARGHTDVTVLDISARALGAAQARLGPAAASAHWLTVDVTAWRPTRRYALWHDRAAFHFLTTAEARAHYRSALDAAVAPGGHVVLATFAPDGPETCSGLPVQRWSAEGLAAELGGGYRLIDAAHETHLTPRGDTQRFVYARLRRD